MKRFDAPARPAPGFSRAVVAAGLSIAFGCSAAGAPRTSPAALPDSAADASARGRVATDSEWASRPATQVEELFVGRFPGVQVMRTPGGLSVRIRGAGTIMGGGDPLYVVDGFPIEAGPNGLIGLNPADIARIEILKDAAALAEYGVRGGNGVVLITTKRAK